MKFDYTRHVRSRMRWRKISPKEVEETILHPDKTEKSIYQRVNVYKILGKKYLKVTFVKEKDKIVIISVVDKND